MPRPTKVPIIYAAYVLNDLNRGYENPAKIDADELNALAVNDGFLVPVAKLRRFFAKPIFFKQFKELMSVSDDFWVRTIELCPSIEKYARRFMKKVPKKKGRPRTKGPAKKYDSRLGSFSEREISDLDSDASAVSIAPSNDECDATDVNLPLPSCAGVRRVCRKYDRNRRYMSYSPDSSENKQYLFQISYDDRQP